MKLHLPAQRILDFDIEARPLGWYGGDWVHKEVTAIAWGWIEEGKLTNVSTWLLTRSRRSGGRMLKAFREAYNEADIVTGHYIRGFDLPVLQMAYMEYNLPLLGMKMTHDTKGDLLKSQGHSKSQENLAAELGIEAVKVHMTTADWRSANRLESAGLDKATERVVGDIRQHAEMREEMLRRGWLRPPRVWLPDHGHAADYTP
jgi:DNA polymerase elongation subunit (family B)